MESAVNAQLADVSQSGYCAGRIWKRAFRLQIEVKDRSTGFYRSPQQAESLSAIGDHNINQQFKII